MCMEDDVPCPGRIGDTQVVDIVAEFCRQVEEAELADCGFSRKRTSVKSGDKEWHMILLGVTQRLVHGHRIPSLLM